MAVGRHIDPAPRRREPRGAQEGAWQQGPFGAAGKGEPRRLSGALADQQMGARDIPQSGTCQHLPRGQAIGRVFRIGDGQAGRIADPPIERAGQIVHRGRHAPASEQHQSAQGIGPRRANGASAIGDQGRVATIGGEQYLERRAAKDLARQIAGRTEAEARHTTTAGERVGQRRHGVLQGRRHGQAGRLRRPGGRYEADKHGDKGGYPPSMNAHMHVTTFPVVLALPPSVLHPVQKNNAGTLAGDGVTTG